jgi:hypothetical protein
MQFRAILRELSAERVEFIVIGGIGAVMRGAPMVTRDLDVVHARGLENRHKLLHALAGMNACYRERLPERFVPTLEDLAAPLTHLLCTRHGDLDLLGTTASLDYEDLLPFAPFLELDPGVPVRVLSLARIIELKTAAGRPKDLAVLPLLRSTLEEQQRKNRPDRG